MITDYDRDIFTAGACFWLAKVIRDMYGYPLAAMWDGFGACGHVFNVLPDGRFIDIDGAHTHAEMIERWGRPNKRHGRRGITTKHVDIDLWIMANPDWRDHEGRALEVAPLIIAEVTG